MAVRMGVKRTEDKPLIQVGCGFDIPTANFIKGAKGETIINGGFDLSIGIVGPGNSYKSMIMHYLTLSAANKIAATHVPYINTYDSEINMKLDRVETFAQRFEYLGSPLINHEDGIWDITDKSEHYGDEWVSIFRDYSIEKAKNEKKIAYTAYKTRKGNYVDYIPTFTQLDSLSELKPKITEDMVQATKKEDTSTATVYMKEGLFKTKFLQDVPSICSKSNIRFITTAHLGKDSEIGVNKYAQPTKKLQFLKEGESIKGVSPKFFFLLSNVWLSSKARVLKNPSTKLPEYPYETDVDNQATDLITVTLTALRSKNGPTGITLDLVISQTYGVSPELTAFHNIKTQGRFGIGGNDRNYYLELMPDVKLSRTTVRKKLEENKMLARAAEITYELLQLKTFHPTVVRSGLWCDPKTLYEDLSDMGYDWNELLQTRNWTAIDQYADHLPPYASVMDLLEFRKGIKKPYWHTVKKEKKSKKA